MTPQYFGNQGATTPQFPMDRRVADLWNSKNSAVSKGRAGHFTVCVNLQAHATAFKAALIQKTV